jgi:hypothetical protein
MPKTAPCSGYLRLHDAEREITLRSSAESLRAQGHDVPPTIYQNQPASRKETLIPSEKYLSLINCLEWSQL